MFENFFENVYLWYNNIIFYFDILKWYFFHVMDKCCYVN